MTRVIHTDIAVLEEHWQPRALAAAAGGDADRRSCARSWLILADATGVGEALAARLRANREHVAVARWGASWRQHDAHIELRAGERGDMDRLLAAVGASAASAAGAAGGRIDHVVHLWSLDARFPEVCSDRDAGAAAFASELDAAFDAAEALAIISARHLAAALVRAGSTARLWLATRGAQNVAQAVSIGHEPTITRIDLQHAAIHGLALAVGQEHPELRCTTIDLDGASRAPAQVTLLTAELLADDPETRIAWRRGTRYAAGLK
jgi:hypothetical protein